MGKFDGRKDEVVGVEDVSFLESNASHNSDGCILSGIPRDFCQRPYIICPLWHYTCSYIFEAGEKLLSKATDDLIHDGAQVDNSDWVHSVRESLMRRD